MIIKVPIECSGLPNLVRLVFARSSYILILNNMISVDAVHHMWINLWYFWLQIWFLGFMRVFGNLLGISITCLHHEDTCFFMVKTSLGALGIFKMEKSKNQWTRDGLSVFVFFWVFPSVGTPDYNVFFGFRNQKPNGNGITETFPSVRLSVCHQSVSLEPW